ncbi:septum formation inhibitor [Pseudomonas oryzihabitans]|uniref:septum site-determining protein MinC n=1 Tax=Pseudomonas rhizoryzae TaxID=2571129 RepID=UPI000735F49F|nr:septum site-determining protein MinC [Pseudomonas rhizoryzae]APQ10007.1 septum site-determining protein MinC [Pseudomonas psychrotolerans]KTS79115.1 septum formation inhibitor [Pseudomonas psychrotolerans]KTS97572.1 septum formation inhibitor [Pseudomonas psychrotolerans]KTT08406.1 septum formation inhibitor [Pseudomonas psychrotolerans]KTT34598.1 septum formation inhibitor [Pseudomonas psychrotolerans]
MTAADPSESDSVFQLKGNMLAVTVLELLRNDLGRLDRQLAQKVAQAPNFFQETPLVLALDKLGEDAGRLDLGALLDLCRRHGLRTLALRASRDEDLAAANDYDLPILPPSSGGRERQLEVRDREPAKPVEPPKPAAPLINPTKIITAPVRGGVQLYAPAGDLVVLAPVSPGAELLADGNIHVYGPMRGRALAGVKGDTKARIFCQQLTAELLSIAGQYKVAEDLRRHPQWGNPVQVSLVGDVLNITRL